MPSLFTVNNVAPRRLSVEEDAKGLYYFFFLQGSMPSLLTVNNVDLKGFQKRSSRMLVVSQRT
jgi:hypothetical protein